MTEIGVRPRCHEAAARAREGGEGVGAETVSVRFLQLILMQSSEKRIERARLESMQNDRTLTIRGNHTQQRGNKISWSEAFNNVSFMNPTPIPDQRIIRVTRGQILKRGTGSDNRRPRQETASLDAIA